ncbi:SDR family oxidoreductase [Lichenicola cladoniae]|uniref:SDR family oxidoreductase n=1 Tax=Lichenicola cladoniae TaxID=1484109 RepID=A0A6M8HPI9_9PROT|nr:SDR family oxidoreductase [Lichenicola cladoniae]NPD69686.1 SDR family oxidoreductase [Acetobacteraceae bacterium]QKE90389.1 SDR family oxidoreductase [Lichenicola cladoniae]
MTAQNADTGTSRVALVTGAGSGIGRAVTLALLQDGWSVVLAGRRMETLQETIGQAGDATRTLACAADVADPNSVDRLFATIQAEFGRLDLLFNNAGINVPGVPFEDLRLEDWNSVVSVNLTGIFLCAQGAFRMMKAQMPRGGRIINNGSISAHAPRPDSAPYTVTKHGVTGLTKTLSLDGRAFDIACGQIDIGNAATALAARMQTGAKQAAGHIAVEPMMDVKDVGRTVVLMASLPLGTNIPFLTVMANAMPFLGRG